MWAPNNATTRTPTHFSTPPPRNGLLANSREQAKMGSPASSYVDPLAQPAPSTPLTNGFPNNLAQESETKRNGRSAIPASHDGKQTPTTNSTRGGAGEVELRRSLLKADRDVAEAKERQMQLLEAVRHLDEQNAKEAAKLFGVRFETDSNREYTPMRQRHTSGLPARPFASPRFEQNHTPDDRTVRMSNQSGKRRTTREAEEDASSLSSLGEQLNRICGVCDQEFPSARARSKHCLSEHGMYSCNYCKAVFDTDYDLGSHRDDRDHW